MNPSQVQPKDPTLGTHKNEFAFLPKSKGLVTTLVFLIIHLSLP